MKLPNKSEISSIFASFSKKEWIVFSALAALLVFSSLWMLESLNRSFMVAVPASGGEISEGVVGAPRFVNPLLAAAPADRDLSSLVYSGLLRKMGGELIPDLADSYDIAKDGLSYTFVLKDDLYFHDGEPLTADDIIFTIEKAKDPVLKSPRVTNWEGVTVEKIDEKTIKFSLKQSFAAFLENTTLGILPEHIWRDSPIELNDANTNPIGTGPFQVEKVSKASSGLITAYELTPFKKFALGRPLIKTLTMRFYPSESSLLSALESGDVDQASSLAPESAETLKDKNYRLERTVLPRVFGLFVNQSQNQIFTDKNVLRAIDLAIDKERIVREVLEGYGEVIDGPIPSSLSPDNNLSATPRAPQTEREAEALALLAKSGWKKGEDGSLEKTTTVNKKKATTGLSFSISTGNAQELAATAELIKEDLLRLGMNVEVKTYETGNLNQGVIRPRKYDALLFGEIVSRESDLFAFWHSSQRKDPGLNIAIYTSSKVDKILEDALALLDPGARAKKYADFEGEIKKDLPAVFLYSPEFIYAVRDRLGGLALPHLSAPEDRFESVYLWYINTDNVWKIFLKNNNE